MALPAQVRRWTREEYYRMVEAGILRPDDRVELVDGEILTLAPQTSVHATAVRLVQEALRQAFGEGSDVRPQLPLTLGEASEPEPDVAVVAGSPRDYLDHHPQKAALVVEVAASSLTANRTIKRALYARSGVPEYWIVDPTARALEVFRSPSEGDYRDHRVLGAGDSIAPLGRPEASIPVADLLP